MNCPRCKQVMIVLELDQIEVDYCLACKGIWFDHGELEALLADEHEKEDFLHSLSQASSCAQKKLKCPVCLKKMKQVWCGLDEKVLIDKCKWEHGIWFDGGELESVLKIDRLDKNNHIKNLLRNIFPSATVI